MSEELTIKSERLSFTELLPTVDGIGATKSDWVYIPTTLGERAVRTDQRFLTNLWLSSYPITDKYPYCYDGMTDWQKISREQNDSAIVIEQVDLFGLVINGKQVGADAFQNDVYNSLATTLVQYRQITKYNKGIGYPADMLQQLELTYYGSHAVAYKHFGFSEKTGALITPNGMSFVSPVAVAISDGKLLFETERHSLREDLRLRGIALLGSPIEMSAEGLGWLNQHLAKKLM